jgi:1,4-dihydroxy-2-naphthoate octaprenyltransferase
MSNIILWIKETRPQFLTLSVVLAFLGTAIAWYHGPVNIGYAFLAGFGLMSTHGSVNAINDYFDYKSGIDLNTRRTPFSGGSGLIPEEKLPLKQALGVGVITFLVALGIGIFFVMVKGWQLIPLLVIAGLLLVLYTPVILRTPWPEWSPGLGLGILPILGFYFVQAGEYDGIVLIASVPSGILVHNLLLLNEFPDVEADRKGGRKTTPVLFGFDAAGRLFRMATILVYVWILACVIISLITELAIMPVYCLIALLTLPFAVKAMKGSREYNDMNKLIPALGSNVQFILFTQILLGVGFILEKWFPLS